MVGSCDIAAVKALPQGCDEGPAPFGRVRTWRKLTVAGKTAARGNHTGPDNPPADGESHRKSYIDAEPGR